VSFFCCSTSLNWEDNPKHHCLKSLSNGVGLMLLFGVVAAAAAGFGLGDLGEDGIESPSVRPNQQKKTIPWVSKPTWNRRPLPSGAGRRMLMGQCLNCCTLMIAAVVSRMYK
jgi:hypothetical protein